MPEVISYEPGVPAWIDLVTGDPAAARAFYAELLGWDFEIGGPETGLYTYCRSRGRNVAGMVGRAVEALPPAWTTYLATDDVEATGRRMVDAGATLTLGPADAGPAGRVVVATDPTGATVGAWEAGEHIGAAVTDEPGAVTWNELITPDLDTAVEFYSKVFSYTWHDETTGTAGPRYQTFAVGGRLAGGATQADTAAHWMPYFAVADADTAAAAAQRLGGAVTVEPTDSTYGRWTALTDPQGAAFTVIQSDAGGP